MFCFWPSFTGAVLSVIKVYIFEASQDLSINVYIVLESYVIVLNFIQASQFIVPIKCDWQSYKNRIEKDM